MKKNTSEPDYIGGEGSLTKEEELALAQYFSKKKDKKEKSMPSKSGKAKQPAPSYLRP